MYCPYCGSENAHTHRFCGECGEPLPQQVASKPTESHQALNRDEKVNGEAAVGPQWTTRTIVPVVLVGLALVVALVVTGVFSPNDLVSSEPSTANSVGEPAFTAEEGAESQSSTEASGFDDEWSIPGRGASAFPVRSERFSDYLEVDFGVLKTSDVAEDWPVTDVLLVARDDRGNVYEGQLTGDAMSFGSSMGWPQLPVGAVIVVTGRLDMPERAPITSLELAFGDDVGNQTLALDQDGLPVTESLESIQERNVDIALSKDAAVPLSSAVQVTLRELAQRPLLVGETQSAMPVVNLEFTNDDYNTRTVAPDGAYIQDDRGLLQEVEFWQWSRGGQCAGVQSYTEFCVWNYDTCEIPAESTQRGALGLIPRLGQYAGGEMRPGEAERFLDIIGRAEGAWLGLADESGSQPSDAYLWIPFPGEIASLPAWSGSVGCLFNE